MQAQKRIKWEAWNKLRGVTKAAAMQKYVNELLSMANKFDVAV
jgi:acyl-CoA-binding protein